MSLRPLLALCGLLLMSAPLAPGAWGAQAAPAALTARWLGVAGLSLTDGEATLLFDPVVTKPGLQHWLLGLKFRSDVPRVRAALKRARIQAADAIFISHTHFDHAVDMAVFSQLTGATVYGGESLGRIASHNDFPVRFSRSEDGRVVQVGKFKVTMLRRTHPPVVQKLGWSFLPGPVPEDFDFGFFGFREGEMWCYFVEHPAGNTLIDSSSHFFEPNAAYSAKVNTYFVGVANKRNLDDLVTGNIARVTPARVVPLHFDLFFLELEKLEKFRFFGGTLDELRKRLGAMPEPRPEFVVPTLYEPIVLH